MDRAWIQWGSDPNYRFTNAYKEGVNSFLEVAKHHVNANNQISCPCMKCNNTNSHPLTVVKIHLLKNGMVTTYNPWIYHGEQNEVRSQTIPNSPVDASEHNTGIFDMMNDLFPMGNAHVTGDRDDIGEDEDDDIDDTSGNQDIQGAYDTIGVHNEDKDNYDKLLQEAERELYPGCTEYSVLTFVVELIHCKVDNLWTNKSVDTLLQMMKKMCPKPNNIPESYYACKKILKGIGLGYETIHVCKHDCALFYKENEGKDKCPVCNEPRYKNSDREQKKKVPQKVLRYFPLKPRLQRLFRSRHTSNDMRWHKDKRVDVEGEMRHPADSIAWKEFDKMYPDFAKDPRNVRLGLATDGFNPFGNMSTSYSMWPVVVVPYNLPPWKCMKKPFSMLTLLISGPQSPGKDIDIFLRPLIDELKELWEKGVETYDKMTESYFTMNNYSFYSITGILRSIFRCSIFQFLDRKINWSINVTV
ncbi:uncharacterized protein LOC112163849 [Rosa chinensis]|uniref:uncharacterized protein LOC112163849 n=1 Tax=Rosa chinensis TaxID=74649 RepID=UPI000D089335|nr:uncharacterized protein LOC112163849 [Rosa chinensis]